MVKGLLVLTLDRAEEIGKRHGKAQADWVVDGNVSKEYASSMIKMHDDGDPVFYDRTRPVHGPLSGVHAGDLTVDELLDEIGIPSALREESEDEVCSAYEEAFYSSWTEEVVRALTAIAEA
ncbi:MAG: hypothetical protein ABIN01_21280 [Ferruginibacter sp.]